MAAGTASPCDGIVHQPDATVAATADADVAYDPGATLRPERLRVPIAVDLLRGQTIDGVQPVLGETPLGVARVDKAGKVIIEGPALASPVVTPRCHRETVLERPMP